MKNHKKASVLAGLAVVGSLLSVSTGALAEQTTAEQATQESDFSEHMDISVAFWDVEKYLTATPDDEALKFMEDKFNVTFVPQNMTWDDYDQKLQLWAASDSLPDIFMGAKRTTATFAKWANEGLLKEIPSDLSKYPNLEKFLDSPQLETCKVDGKIYCLFRRSYTEQAGTSRDTTIAYRWDLAQKAGVTKEPETWEEFDDMIQKIIENDPEGKEIKGMTAKSYGMLRQVFVPYTSPLASHGGVSFYWVDNGDGEYVPAYFEGETLGSKILPTWKLLRHLYEDGTIDKDLAVITSTQATESFLQGNNAAILSDGGADSIWSIGQNWEDVYERDFFDDVKILGLMEDENGNPTYPITPDSAWSETYISSHVDDEKLDRILAIYDFLTTEEGYIFGNCGIEGKTYGRTADGEITYEGYNDGGVPGDTYQSLNLFSKLAMWARGSEWYDELPSTVPEQIEEADAKRVDLAKTLPIPEYNYECTSKYLELGLDFTITLEDDILNIMTGTEDVEKMWNDRIEKYKSDGLEDVIAQINEAVKAE